MNVCSSVRFANAGSLLRRAAPAAVIACLLAAAAAAAPAPASEETAPKSGETASNNETAPKSDEAANSDETATKPGETAGGDVLLLVPLRDQHDRASQIGPSTAMVLFTRDMDGGALAKEALADGGRQALEAARAVYVSDVSRMPSLIRSMFALPALRRRLYPVVLDETGYATAALPHRPGTVTILQLNDLHITSVSFAASSAEVRAAVQP